MVRNVCAAEKRRSAARIVGRQLSACDLDPWLSPPRKVAVNGEAESYGVIIYNIYKSLVPTVGELQYLWGEAVSLDNSTIPFAPIDIAPCRHRVSTGRTMGCSLAGVRPARCVRRAASRRPRAQRAHGALLSRCSFQAARARALGRRRRRPTRQRASTPSAAPPAAAPAAAHAAAHAVAPRQEARPARAAARGAAPRVIAPPTAPHLVRVRVRVRG